MIYFACPICLTAIRTVGNFDEVDHLVGTKCEWYPNRYPCPVNGCDGRMTLTDIVASEDMDDLNIHDLTPQETFQAFCGMGLPAERQCSEARVRKLLVGKTITRIEADHLAGNRTVLHAVYLDDGHRVYLAASPYGPVVYRIAEPRVKNEYT